MNHTEEKLNSNDKSILLLTLAGLATVIMWQIPFGGFIIYPFTLLSTWFHEMGHGLAAILLGGNFHKLEIFASAGGLAYTSGHQHMFVGARLGQVLVSFGGLIGPPIAGALFILAGRKKFTSRISLIVFSFFLIASSFIWIRTLVGVSIIVSFGLIAAFIALKGSARWQQFTIQFFGMQALLATFRRMDYLFTPGCTVGGVKRVSDVGSIAEQLFLPYWFWGALISALSVLLAYIAFKMAFKSKN